MRTGRVLRFDETRGYGFIAPDSGGEDVFVHANDLGEQKFLVRPGTLVEFEVEDGNRGLKASSVRVVGQPSVVERTVHREPTGEDDGLCDVLSTADFSREVTDLLLEADATLTGGQILRVRDRLSMFARKHGWVEN